MKSALTHAKIKFIIFFVSYTVPGKIVDKDKYKIDLFDSNLFLNIVIDDSSVPNEQQTDEYFTITVYNIVFPWTLDEPFPEDETKPTLFSKIVKFSKSISRYFKR